MFYVIDTNIVTKEALIFDTGSLDLEWETYADIEACLRNGMSIENIPVYQIDNLIEHKDLNLVIVKRGEYYNLCGYLDSEGKTHSAILAYKPLSYYDLPNTVLFSDKYPCWLKISGISRVQVQYHNYYYDIEFYNRACIINGKEYIAKKGQDLRDDLRLGKIGIVKDSFVIEMRAYRFSNLIKINKDGGIRCSLYNLKTSNKVGRYLDFKISRKNALLRYGKA